MQYTDPIGFLPSKIQFYRIFIAHRARDAGEAEMGAGLSFAPLKVMGFAIITVIFLVAVGFLLVVGGEMWKYTREHPDQLAKKKNEKIMKRVEREKKHEDHEEKKAS